jgi:LCP family protein required for cell wall assembly
VQTEIAVHPTPAVEEIVEEDPSGTLQDPDLWEHSFVAYISGIDTYGPVTTRSRSDVNIMAIVNTETKTVLLISTPRDFYVPFNFAPANGAMDKLTHAGIYGINTSIETIESIYDVPVDYYVRVNFTSVINIVDALGGIDVYVEEPFGDFHHGINHMDGETALAFSRERYSFATGDNQRGRDQEAVIAAIIDKLTSKDVLLHADELMAVMSTNMQTSLTREDITKLVSRQLQDGGNWDIQMQAATGTGDSQTTFSMGDTKLFVMLPDEEVIADLSARIKEVLAAR